MTVDLPAPLGPIREITLPLGRAKLTPSTTVFPSYCLSIPVHAWSHLLSCQEEVEEVKAAAHGDEHAHRHGVGIHMLDDELPAHQHDHAEQGRAQHQLGVAEGLSSCRGQVGDDEPQKGDGPHHGGGHGDAEVTPSSRRRMQRS